MGTGGSTFFSSTAGDQGAAQGAKPGGCRGHYPTGAAVPGRAADSCSCVDRMAAGLQQQQSSTWNAGRSAAAANWRSDARLSRAEGGAWRAARTLMAPVLGPASRLKVRAHCRLAARCRAVAALASASAARPRSSRAPSRGSRCLSAMLSGALLPSRRAYALGGLQPGGQREQVRGGAWRVPSLCIPQTADSQAIVRQLAPPGRTQRALPC